MLVAALRSHRYLIPEVAGLLHEEWGNLPAWSDRRAFYERLGWQPCSEETVDGELVTIIVEHNVNQGV
jgi:hypothetical protein